MDDKLASVKSLAARAGDAIGNAVGEADTIGIHPLNAQGNTYGKVVVARELVWLEYVKDHPGGAQLLATLKSHKHCNHPSRGQGSGVFCGKMERVLSYPLSKLDAAERKQIEALGGILGVASGTFGNWERILRGHGDAWGVVFNVNTMVALYDACMFHDNDKGVLSGNGLADYGRKAARASEYLKSTRAVKWVRRVGAALQDKDDGDPSQHWLENRKRLYADYDRNGLKGACRMLPPEFLKAVKEFKDKLGLPKGPTPIAELKQGFHHIGSALKRSFTSSSLGGRPSKTGKKGGKGKKKAVKPKNRRPKAPKMPRGAKVGTRVGHWVVYRRRLTPADKAAGRKIGRKALRYSPRKGGAFYGEAPKGHKWKGFTQFNWVRCKTRTDEKYLTARDDGRGVDPHCMYPTNVF